jgi:hypothetical protein
VRDITIHPALNPLEVIQVEDYMAKHSPKVTHYTMTQGNNCIWVYYSYMNLYFIFRNGKIADVQID